MSTELIRSLIPLIIFQVTLQIASLIHLAIKKKTANLSVWIWAAIIIFGEIFGVLFYFAFGRSDE
jgi:heme/copper-type cytochrome/quinol oxidase subunit 4